MAPNTWHRSSPVSILYHLLQGVRGMVNLWPVLAGIVFLESSRDVLVIYVVPVLVAMLILSALLNYWFFRFSFDEDKIQIRSGVISRKRLTLNFDRVQEANLQQSFYFRPFDLWTVGLESAGSKAQEIKIPGIHLSLAEAIKGYHLSQQTEDLAVNEASRNAQSTSDELEDNVAATPSTISPQSARISYQLSLGLAAVIRFGLMHNGLIYVLMIGSAMVGQSPDMLQRLGDFVGIDALRESISTSLKQSFLSAVLVTISAAIAGMILLYGASIVLAILKYWGYELIVTGDRLQYRAGLLNKVQRSFKHHKLQSVEIFQGPIARLLQRYTMRLHQTNEVADRTSSGAGGFEIPVLTVTELNELKTLLHIDAVDWRRANPMRIVWRTLGWGVPLTAMVLVPVLTAKLSTAAYALLPIPLLASLFTGLWYRSGYAFSAHWMVLRQGFLGCRYTYVPCTKVQIMDLTQGPLLRLHGASTLLIWNGADVQRFEFVSSAVLTQAKARIGALVAESRARWM